MKKIVFHNFTCDQQLFPTNFHSNYLRTRYTHYHHLHYHHRICLLNPVTTYPHPCPNYTLSPPTYTQLPPIYVPLSYYYHCYLSPTTTCLSLSPSTYPLTNYHHHHYSILLSLTAKLVFLNEENNWISNNFLFYKLENS